MNEMRKLMETIKKIDESKVTFRGGLKITQDEWRITAEKLEEAHVTLGELAASLDGEQSKAAQNAQDSVETAMWQLRLR